MNKFLSCCRFCSVILCVPPPLLSHSSPFLFPITFIGRVQTYEQKELKSPFRSLHFMQSRSHTIKRNSDCFWRLFSHLLDVTTKIRCNFCFFLFLFDIIQLCVSCKCIELRLIQQLICWHAIYIKCNQWPMNKVDGVSMQALPRRSSFIKICQLKLIASNPTCNYFASPILFWKCDYAFIASNKAEQFIVPKNNGAALIASEGQMTKNFAEIIANNNKSRNDNRRTVHGQKQKTKMN